MYTFVVVITAINVTVKIAAWSIRRSRATRPEVRALPAIELPKFIESQVALGSRARKGGTGAVIAGVATVSLVLFVLGLWLYSSGVPSTTRTRSLDSVGDGGEDFGADGFTDIHGPVVKGDVRVRGYWRKNGTYVTPHTRTPPDDIMENNRSYVGKRDHGSNHHSRR
jgi:hypothetical protein